MHARPFLMAGVLLTLAASATGCATHGQVTTGTPPPPAIAEPDPGSATNSPFGTGDPLAYDCGELVGRDALAQLDPGLTLQTDRPVANGSSSEEALALKGTVCAWSDESAAVSLVVTAAKPDAPTFAALKQKASAGSPDAEFGSAVAAYLRDDELQLFTRDGYWATAKTTLFDDRAALTKIGRLLLEQLPAA